VFGRSLDLLGVACDRWGELTAQPQNWSLFAPHFGRVASQPVVRLVWRDAGREVRIPGHFLPADPDRYAFRPPEPRCRLYGYEFHISLAGWTWDPRPLDDQARDLATTAGALASRQRRSVSAYLRWQLVQYRTAHPDEPTPDVVELRAALIPAPDVASGVRPPGRELFLAAWEPRTEPPPGRFPLRVLDPATGRLEWLPAEEGS
jgi:hypothetical protein